MRYRRLISYLVTKTSLAKMSYTTSLYSALDSGTSKSYTFLSTSFPHQYSGKSEDENRSISERVSLYVCCLTHDTLHHTTSSTHNHYPPLVSHYPPLVSHYLPLTTLLCHSRFSQTRQTPCTRVSIREYNLIGLYLEHVFV